MSGWVLSAVVIGLSLAGLGILNERPITGTEEDPLVYNLVGVDAPVLRGFAIQVFSYLATQSPLKPLILRSMMNQNAVHQLRELGAKHPDLPPTYFPIHRLPSSLYQGHIDLSQTCTLSQSVLHKGFPSQEETESTDESECGDYSSNRFRTCEDYHKLYKSGKATPDDVIEKTLALADQVEKELKIFAWRDESDARQQAKASTERWKRGQPLSILDGVPVVIKDMVHVRKYRMWDGGSVPTEVSQVDDSTVRNLKEAGAIIIGTTVMTEGGVSPLGFNSFYGGPFNPYGPKDKLYYPGGSSSGSAVAVATGLVPLALGFDGGGSIRLPSAMSGVFGLAASFGRICFDSDAKMSTMIKAGPIAATSKDAALGYMVLSKQDTTHFFSELYDGGNLGPPPPHLHGFMDVQDLKGVRLGVFWDHFLDSDVEVHSKCLEALRHLESKGAQIVNVTIPHLREMSLAHSLKILSEFALLWDAKFHNPQKFKMEPSSRITVALGKSISANEVLAGDRVRTLGIKLIRDEIFAKLKVDAIVSPAMGVKVPEFSPAALETGESNLSLTFNVMKYICLSNLLGMPAMTFPIGYEAETSLPISIHLLASNWNEATLLRLAHALEVTFLQRKTPQHHFVDPLADWIPK